MTTKPIDNEEVTRFRGLHYIDLARAALAVKDYASANGYFCKAMHLNVEWPEEERAVAKYRFRDFLSNTLEGDQTMVESPCYFVTLYNEVILARFNYSSEGKQSALDFALKTILSSHMESIYADLGIECMDWPWDVSLYSYSDNKVWLEGEMDYGGTVCWSPNADAEKETENAPALAVATPT